MFGEIWSIVRNSPFIDVQMPVSWLRSYTSVTWTIPSFHQYRLSCGIKLKIPVNSVTTVSIIASSLVTWNFLQKRRIAIMILWFQIFYNGLFCVLSDGARVHCLVRPRCFLRHDSDCCKFFVHYNPKLSLLLYHKNPLKPHKNCTPYEN